MTLTADAAFVAATNRDVEAMSRSGSFRSDLFFRLSRFVITIRHCANGARTSSAHRIIFSHT
jgi:transcriptional regulator of acetoin/glycerol metabolism